MNVCLRSIAWLVILLVTPSAWAQVPGLLNHQGRVAVGGRLHDGIGHFKFALLDGDTSATLWSNDGSSIAGSEPSNALDLNVVKGNYAVLLGNPPSAPIPHETFRRPNVQLRIWFDDGTHGFERLDPDQRIAAVGYAMVAGTVADGSITASKIAPGAIQAQQLSAGAVTTESVATGAITAAALEKPPRSGSLTARDLNLVSGAAGTYPFTVDFPIPFSSTPSVTFTFEAPSSANVSAIFGSLSSRSPEGFSGQIVLTEPLNNHSITFPQADASNLAVINGRPAFMDSLPVFDLGRTIYRYHRAKDPAGNAWHDPVTIDLGIRYHSGFHLTLINGHPAVAMHQHSDDALVYMRALNAEGTEWEEPLTVDDDVPPTQYGRAATIGREPFLLEVDGHPAIAYGETGSNDANDRLKYVRANDANGTSWGDPKILHTGAHEDEKMGLNPEIVFLGGVPVVFYGRNDDRILDIEVLLIRAEDPAGITWGAPEGITVGFARGYVESDGLPGYVYGLPDGVVRYRRALDPLGEAWGDAIHITSSFWADSVAVIASKPALVGKRYNVDGLYYIQAQNAQGSSWGLPVLQDATGRNGYLVEAEGQAGILFNKNDDAVYVRLGPPALALHWMALEP